MAPIENQTTTPEYKSKEITSFQIGKDVISAGFLQLKMQQGVANALLENKADLGKVQANRLSVTKTKTVFDHLDSMSVSERDIDDVKISSKGIMRLEFTGANGTHEINIDLLKEEDFILGDAEEFYTHQQKVNFEIQDTYKSMDTITDAMHIIFMKNEDELFGALDDKDDALTQKSLKKYMQKGDDEKRFEPYLEMNLKELSAAFKKYSVSFDSLKKQFRGEHPGYDDLLATKEQHISMAMGISDEYEGGAEYIEFSEAEFSKDLGEVVAGKSIEELLDYVRTINKKIDLNDYQSTPVEKSYKLFSNKLNTLTFDRLTKEDAPKESFLEFVKIISGIDETLFGDKGVDDRLKSDSENMAIMNDVILHLMTRERGIMDTVNKSESGLYQLEDKEIGDQDTGKIVHDFKQILIERAPELTNLGADITGIDRFINGLGYGDILDIDSGTSYSELNFQQKAKISVVYRVLEKLEQSDSLGNNIYDNGLAFTNYKYKGEYHGGDHVITTTNLQDIFTSVAVNANEELTENMTDVFQESDGVMEWLNGKSAESFGLEDPADIEIFNFFKEYQGIGALDFSERSISNLKTTGKIAGVVAVAMAILPVTAALAGKGTATAIAIGSMSAIKQGMIMGATASVASIAINPKGYDSVSEGVVDITTDIVVGTITGAAGGWLVQRSGVHYVVNKETGTRVQFTAEMKEQILANGYDVKGLPLSPSQIGEIGALKNKAIFVTDLSLFGIVPEAGRMWGVDTRFHGSD